MSVLELGPTSIVLPSGERVWGTDFRDRTLVLQAAPHFKGVYRAQLDTVLYSAKYPSCLRAPTELIVLGADCARLDVSLVITIDGRTTVLAGAQLVAGMKLVMPVYIPSEHAFTLRATGPAPFTLYLHTLAKLTVEDDAALTTAEQR